MATMASSDLPVKHPDGSPEQRVKALGYALPPFPKPAGEPQIAKAPPWHAHVLTDWAGAGLYSAFTLVGDLMYVSGQLPSRADGSLHVGKVSAAPSAEGEIDVPTARLAGRDCALTTLSLLQGALGSLDRVVRIVKLVCMVNCSGDFKDPPAVANAYSEVMLDVFGEAGRSARSAVGHASLPFGVPIEVEAIVQVEVGSPKI